MSFDRIISENLALWREAAAENRELRLLAVTEAASKAAAEWEAGEADPATWRIMPPSLSASPLVPPVAPFAEMLALDEQLAFCRALRALCPRFPHENEESEVPLPFPAAPRVAMPNGDFFTEALDSFSAVIPHATPLRVQSFSAVLEEVALGNADLALLPAEDERGGKRISLYEECDRLELHINCVANAPLSEGARQIQLALISREATLPFTVLGEEMLECRIAHEDDRALADFLAAAAACGLTLSRVDSLPDPHGDSTFAYQAVLAVGGGDAALLEAYMALRLPRSFVTGRYLCLNS